MAQAGKFRDRAVFQRLALAGSDGYGNVHQTWSDYLTVWADLREQPGREALAGNALEGSARGTLRFRTSAAAATITAADRVFCRGAYWNVTSRPAQVGHVPHVLEVTVERGVAI